MKRRNGFTLMELLAVIAIMGILAVAAISGYTTMTKNSKKKTYEARVAELENAAVKFAKETNLKSTVTISVNRLVVQGYIQPDESTASGLANVKNPETDENMICNLINISIKDDDYVADYLEDKKDCTVAEKDMVDANINVTARELTGSTLGDTLAINGSNVVAWSSKDVVLTTTSSVYTNVVSISYDFGGQTVTKQKGALATGSTYDDSQYNRIAIKDVRVMFNSEVTITYNMTDGTTHSRTVTVRIDKEPPTARSVISNDVTVGSTKKVSLYLDDGNGSGVVGFYVSSSPTSFPASGYINESTNRPGQNNGDGKFEGYNSYFYAQKGNYYIKVVDAVGNSYITPEVIVSNFERTIKSCTITVSSLDSSKTWVPEEDWYNESIRVTGTSNHPVGTMGVKYIVNYFSSVPNEKKLTDYFDGATNGGILSDYKDQTEESDRRTYYLAMKGQNRDEPISYCTKLIGVDKTPPTASLACTDNDCDTYEQTHRITITLTDDRSGFYTDAHTIKVGWSTSKTTAPTQWRSISGGDYKKKANGTNNEKVVIFTTNVNGPTSTEHLTGIYYMWVKGDSFADKAHNKGSDAQSPPINYVLDIPISYDNTKPTCTSKGGVDAWYRVTRTIYGECWDGHSGCAYHDPTGKYSYDNNGKVTRTIDYEINSTTESPGEIYDKAGNHTTCPGDQTVRIDLTKPECSATNKTTSYTAGGASFNVHCTDSGGSKLSTCDGVTTGDVNSYDRAKSGITATDSYNVEDVAGNTNSCSIGINDKDYYRYRTRTWNNCKTGHNTCKYGCDTCGGGSYSCPDCSGVTALSACPAPGQYTLYLDGGQSSGSSAGKCCYPKTCYYPTYDCNCSNCYTGENTCKGGWNDYGNWSAWDPSNYCTATDGSCDDESAVWYKNS